MRIVTLVVATALSLTAHAQDITLDQLLEHADQSPMLGLSAAEVRDATAVLEGERPVFPTNPSVWVGLGQRGPDGGLEVQAQIQQQIQIAGQRGLRRDAARRGIDAAEERQESVRVWLRGEVRRLAYQAMLGRQRLEIAERSRQLAERVREIAVRRVEAGEASPLEVLVADSDVVHAREGEIRARQLERDSRVQLAGLVGWSSEAVPPVRESLPAVASPNSLPRLLERIAASPVMRTRELALRAAEAGLDAANRGAWPNPSLGLYYGREGDAAQVAHVWLVTLGLPLPLARRNDRGRARARATLFRRERELEAAAMELRMRVTRLRIETTAAAERVQLYEGIGMESATEKLSRTERAFELGDLSLLEVSQTRQRLLRVLEEEIEARADYYDVAMRLESVLGETEQENER